MKIEAIKALAAQDAKISQCDLDDESLKSSILHQKWYDILMDEILTLKRCENELETIYRAKWLYYSGKADKAVYDKDGDFNLKVTGTDLKMFITSDETYLKAKTTIDEQREKVAYIEGVIKNINQRSYNIKNAIEWRKFTHCQT